MYLYDHLAGGPRALAQVIGDVAKLALQAAALCTKKETKGRIRLVFWESCLSDFSSFYALFPDPGNKEKARRHRGRNFSRCTGRNKRLLIGVPFLFRRKPLPKCTHCDLPQDKSRSKKEIVFRIFRCSSSSETHYTAAAAALRP